MYPNLKVDLVVCEQLGQRIFYIFMIVQYVRGTIGYVEWQGSRFSYFKP